MTKKAHYFEESNWKNRLKIDMLATIVKYEYDNEFDSFELELRKQIFSYFESCQGDKACSIKPLVIELIRCNLRFPHQNLAIKKTIIEAVDDYFIGQNVNLQERLKEIKERGALEAEHVNAKKNLEAYQKAGAIRNIEAPPELTLPTVRAAEVELGVHATYNPSKWADPADEEENPHPEIGNPIFDPRARMNPNTPGFAFDPQYGRPLVERETGVRNRDRERKILLEQSGPHRGRPINPMGKTGITGRGLLGKFGPNSAADSLVKRLNPQTGLIEIVAIYRKHEKQWALPGGMIDPGELAIQTACREFAEEAGNIPLVNLTLFIEKLKMWAAIFNLHMHSQLEAIVQSLQQEKKNLAVAENAQQQFFHFKTTLQEESLVYKVFAKLDFNHDGELLIKSEDNLTSFIDQINAVQIIKPMLDDFKKIYQEGFLKVLLGSSRATEVYKGYVDDPRNTDHAWMETSAYAWEIGTTNPLEQEILCLCESGDDATMRDMVDPIATQLFASHSAIAAKMIVGEKSSAALELPPEQLANFLMQRAAAAHLLLAWPN